MGGRIDFVPFIDTEGDKVKLSRGSDIVRHFIDPLSLSGNPYDKRVAKNAADDLKASQNAVLKEAEDKATMEESTTKSAISRARQKALAVATAASGRKSTIKTGSGGLIGSATGTEKSLIGE